jgi:hypothetical protein
MSNFKKLMMTAAGGAGLNVEDVFSTDLWNGNSSYQDITNGIDLANEEYMLWIKKRNSAVFSDPLIYDSVRTYATKTLSPNSTGGETSQLGVYAFNTDGYGLMNDSGAGQRVNTSGYTYAGWTFRKAPKFFDVVTFAGTGSNQTISHNLGSTPGMIIVKDYSGSGGWIVYHRSNGATKFMYLNGTTTVQTSSLAWNDTAPTSTEFTVGTLGGVNNSGRNYVAYLFAHNNNDGEFGPNADQDIIKCGTYTGNASNGNFVNVGFEPQWVLIKNTQLSGTDYGWYIWDTTRGMPFYNGGDGPRYLRIDSSAEVTYTGGVSVRAKGFELSNFNPVNFNNHKFIYVAIRRGPMATPESASEVFGLNAYTGNNSSGRLITSSGTGITDMAFINRALGGSGSRLATRLGGYSYVVRDDFNGEINSNTRFKSFDDNNGFYIGSSDQVNSTQSTYVAAMWSRAHEYFDVVEYSGTGSTGVKDHNLGVVPEMMWFKNRKDTDPWGVYHKDVGATKYIPLHTNSAPLTTSLAFGNTAPTATQFTVGSTFNFNSSQRYSAMLFASVSGVSKVGSYTGNGTSQTIDCGFSSGASYVLIKRTDAVGNWVESNSEYGIVAANETAFLVDTGAKTASHDFIDPANSGFIVNQDTVTNINVNNATYIFYAIA